MGKISGGISSIVAIGILAFLIYFCCLRRKRQRAANGTIIHVTTGSRLQPAVPNGTHYNPTQYPYPATNYPYGQAMPMPAHGIYPGDSNSQPMQYPSYPNQNNPYPYPAYPPTSGVGMSMPMPLDNASHVQSSALYPSAPPPQFNDLPPPYSDVTKR